MKLKKSIKGFQVDSSKYFEQPLIHRRKIMSVMQVLPGTLKFNGRRKVGPDQRSIELAEVELYSDPSNSKHNLRSKQLVFDTEEIKVLPLQNELNQNFTDINEKEKSESDVESVQGELYNTQDVPQIQDPEDKTRQVDEGEVVLYDQRQSWWEESAIGKFCMFLTYSLIGPAEEKELQA